MAKIAGYIVLSVTALTISVVIMIAQLAMKVDGISRGLPGQIPPIVYVVLLIPIAIGVYLIDLGNKKDKEVKNE